MSSRLSTLHDCDRHTDGRTPDGLTEGQVDRQSRIYHDGISSYGKNCCHQRMWLVMRLFTSVCLCVSCSCCICYDLKTSFRYTGRSSECPDQVCVSLVVRLSEMSMRFVSSGDKAKNSDHWTKGNMPRCIQGHN